MNAQTKSPFKKDGMFNEANPFGIYVAEFYCHKIKLIIEVDGSIHEKEDIKKYDIKRENDLINDGYTVLRFSNYQVLQEIEYVLSIITTRTQNLLNNYKNSTT